MKYKFTLLAVLLIQLHSIAQSENPKYDKVLADSLGGNDYGMKSYVLVILKTGPAKIEDKKLTDSLFAGHLANIGRLASQGKLVVAGPIGKNEKNYRGIFILNVKTIEQANTLLATDPAVREKILEAEVYTWYGSAALPTYLPNHEKIEKKKM